MSCRACPKLHVSNPDFCALFSLFFSRPDGNPIRQRGSCCHQICQHRAVLSYVQERHPLWIGVYTTRQHCFLQVKMGGEGGEGSGRYHVHRGSQMSVYPKHASVRRQQRESSAGWSSGERSERRNQSRLYTWAAGPTAPAARVGWFRCQNK